MADQGDKNNKDDFLDRIRAIAKELEMDDEDTEKFVTRAAEKKGYKKVVTWERGSESGSSEGGSGWFK